jgi:hypothetical protein
MPNEALQCIQLKDVREKGDISNGALIRGKVASPRRNPQQSEGAFGQQTRDLLREVSVINRKGSDTEPSLHLAV